MEIPILPVAFHDGEVRWIKYDSQKRWYKSVLRPENYAGLFTEPQSKLSVIEVVLNTIDGTEFTGAKLMSDGSVAVTEGKDVVKVLNVLMGRERQWTKVRVGTYQNGHTVRVINVVYAPVMCSACKTLFPASATLDMNTFSFSPVCPACQQKGN